jgi:hypothetical protein
VSAVKEGALLCLCVRFFAIRWRNQNWRGTVECGDLSPLCQISVRSMVSRGPREDTTAIIHFTLQLQVSLRNEPKSVRTSCLSCIYLSRAVSVFPIGFARDLLIRARDLVRGVSFRAFVTSCFESPKTVGVIHDNPKEPELNQAVELHSVASVFDGGHGGVSDFRARRVELHSVAGPEGTTEGSGMKY